MLKKSTIIELSPAKNELDLNRLNFIKNLLTPLDITNEKVYIIVEKLIHNIKFNNFSYSLFLKLCIYIFELENAQINIQECVLCKTKERIDTIDFMCGGLLCFYCRIKNNSRSIEPILLRKIIKLFYIENLVDIIEIYFDFQEVKITKELFSLFLNENLGLNSYYLKKI